MDAVSGLLVPAGAGDTPAVPVKLKAYVALVAIAGVALALGLASRVPPDQLRQHWLVAALFAGCILVGELLVLPIRHRGEIRELTVTNTPAFALAVLLGPAMAVPLLALGSAGADLLRRKPPVKVAFNAGQWALSLAAGAAVYGALGGTPHVGAASVLALLAGGGTFLLLNHVLVGVVVSLANATPLRRGLVADLRIEVGTSAMLLALAPVAVLLAQHALPLVVALLLPVMAVHLASKGELDAHERRAEAEALAERQRRVAAEAAAAAERQRRLTAREQQLVEQLQETYRMKQDLLATVTHELRSPLTTILGTYRMLEERGDQLDAAGRAELIQMGARQSERLKRMIEQLLVAARFQEGATPLPLAQAELDAAELARQAGTEARARHPDRRIVVQAERPLPVRAAPDAIVQVLGNLIDNACKYARGPVRVVATGDGVAAVLAVEDRGPGIAPADRERIFERFTQLDVGATRRANGVGLGLYIARQLARGQEGDLVVTRAQGAGGARFELRLPLLRQAAGG